MKTLIAVILAGTIGAPALAEPATQAITVAPTTIAVPVGSAIVNTTVTTTKDTPVDTSAPKRRGLAQPLHKRDAIRSRVHTQGWKVSRNAILTANPTEDAKWRNRARSNVKFGDRTPTITTTTTTTTAAVPAIAVVPTVIIKSVVAPKSK